MYIYGENIAAIKLFVLIELKYYFGGSYDAI